MKKICIFIILILFISNIFCVFLLLNFTNKQNKLSENNINEATSVRIDNMNIKLCNKSFELINLANPYYADVVNLSEYEYTQHNHDGPSFVDIESVGNLQNERDLIFPIFENSYIYYNYDDNNYIPGVYYDYYTHNAFTSYSQVSLCWLTQIPNTDEIDEIQTDATFSIRRYINVYENVYIMYYGIIYID